MNGNLLKGYNNTAGVNIMNEKELLQVALEAGEILLTSGAEIYRVEETIVRICESYGISCESFVLPTGMFVSVTGKNGETLSLTRRIKGRDVDLHRIEMVNKFSRDLQKQPLMFHEVVKILGDIKRKSPYKFTIRFLTAGLIAFVFTLLFKGTIFEAVPALLISIIIYIIREQISRFGFFKFFEYFISGMIATSISLVVPVVLPGLDLNIYRIIVGSIIMLLPGVAITNGIKDALYGDIVSSLSGVGEAVFIAAAVGAGASLVLWIQFSWF